MPKTASPTKTSPKASSKITQSLRTTPKDVFLTLLMLVLLYICVISMISLLFTYIDYKFPDLLTFYPYGSFDTIRTSSSMLIVAFPLLMLLSWFIQKDIKKMPEKHELKFRKWLTYSTLFVSAITVIVDLIQLVQKFYSGELTLPFSLKVLSVLILAGGVFGYFVWDVQSKPHKSKIPAMVGFTSTVLVIAVLVLGFVVVGSPMKQRQIRMDERRISDLQTIQYQIIDYWRYKEALPATTDELKNSISGFSAPLDPETEKSYEYKVISPLKFSLCATFNQDNPYSKIKAQADYPYSAKCFDGNCGPYGNDTWEYEKGYKCFERTIDPKLYPKYTD